MKAQTVNAIETGEHPKWLKALRIDYERKTITVDMSFPYSEEWRKQSITTVSYGPCKLQSEDIYGFRVGPGGAKITLDRLIYVKDLWNRYLEDKK